MLLIVTCLVVLGHAKVYSSFVIIIFIIICSFVCLFEPNLNANRLKTVNATGFKFDLHACRDSPGKTSQKKFFKNNIVARVMQPLNFYFMIS